MKIKTIVIISIFYILVINNLLAQAVPIIPETANFLTAISELLAGKFATVIGGLVLVGIGIWTLIKGLPVKFLIYWVIGVALTTQHQRVFDLIKSAFQ